MRIQSTQIKTNKIEAYKLFKLAKKFERAELKKGYKVKTFLSNQIKKLLNS